jgi:hypothetical protein
MDERCQLAVLSQLQLERVGTHATVLDPSSKGKNIHIITCILHSLLEYSEYRLGSFDSNACNKYVRRILPYLTGRYALKT